jgi:hypothetical protein
VDYDDVMASRIDGAAAPNGYGTRRVIGWVSTASIENKDLVDIGGWGGFFQRGDDWSAYIANIDKQFAPHHESLRLAIIAKGLRRGDDWHQNSQDGVPVFDDGAVGTFSFAPGAISWRRRGRGKTGADTATWTFTWTPVLREGGSRCRRCPARTSR